jgi:hypothetical protein
MKGVENAILKGIFLIGKKKFFGKNFLGKNFLAKTFWDALFTKVHFRNEYEKTDFLIPYSIFLKKKSFHLLEGTINLFGNLKGQNGRTC